MTHWVVRESAGGFRTGQTSRPVSSSATSSGRSPARCRSLRPRRRSPYGCDRTTHDASARSDYTPASSNQCGHCTCDFTEWIRRKRSSSAASRLPAARGLRRAHRDETAPRRGLRQTGRATGRCRAGFRDRHSRAETSVGSLVPSRRSSMPGWASMKEARRGSSHLVERLGVARTVKVVTERKPRMRWVASAMPGRSRPDHFEIPLAGFGQHDVAARLCRSAWCPG